MRAPPTPVGRHVVAELWGCAAIDGPEALLPLMRQAAAAAGATVLGELCHAFAPQGLTGLLLLAESHLSLHTWPERRYVAIDIFTCGTRTDPHAAVHHLMKALTPERSEIRTLERGIADAEPWFWQGAGSGQGQGDIRHGLRIERRVHRERTAAGEVHIFDSPTCGRVLAIDGVVQLATADGHIRHEMLVQPALLTHPAPKRVMIVGGGDGGALRECLRHDPGRVLMVDVDARLVELCRAHLPGVGAGAFEHPAVEVAPADAPPAADRGELFDVVVVDRDADASAPLSNPGLYASLRRLLLPDGVLAVRVGSLLDAHRVAAVCRRIAEALPDVRPLRLTVPSDHCGESCVVLATGPEGPAEPTIEEIEHRLAARGLSGALRHYGPAMHHAARTWARDPRRA